MRKSHKTQMFSYFTEAINFRLWVSSPEWTKLNALVNFIAGYYDKKNEFKNCEFAIDSNKYLFDIIKKNN